MQFTYFPGCSLESTAKEYDHSARSVCRALGIDLIELKDWICCGATSAHSINKMLSVSLPAWNIAAAQDAGSDMVIPCAACYNTMKKTDYTLRNDKTAREKIENIVEFKYTGDIKIMSLLEAMVDQVGTGTIAGQVCNPLEGLNVVCYYGCLLVRPPEVTCFDRPENPVSLDRLMKSLGATVLKWSYKTDCCGANLSLTSTSVVEGMVSRLLNAAREAGAQAVVTACPLCHSNLEMRRKEYSSELPVFYFTELMGLALGLPNYSKWLSSHLVDPQPVLQNITGVTT